MNQWGSVTVQAGRTAEMRTRKTIQKVKGTIQMGGNIVVKEWTDSQHLGVTVSGVIKVTL